MIIYTIGPSSRPFEPARGKDALREEDEFMELHGGRGSRWIYLAVEWLASIGGLPKRMLRRSAKRENGAPLPRGARPPADEQPCFRPLPSVSDPAPR